MWGKRGVQGLEIYLVSFEGAIRKETHTTFYGKALAIVRAGKEPGKICIKVSRGERKKN